MSTRSSYLGALSLLLAASAPALGQSELVRLRSGVDPVTYLGNGLCCEPLSPDPFTPDDFAAALAGPVAPLLAQPFSAWVDELSCAPQARWIAPAGSGQNVVGSALFAAQFEVLTPGDPTGVVTLCWAADDRLGDLDGEPNEAGLYLNGQPLSPVFRGPALPVGGSQQRQAYQVDVPLLTGTNTVHVYLRDVGAAYSGLMFGLEVQVGGCPPVVEYCQSLPNSTGVAAQLSLQGSRSVAANDTVLEVSGCPPGAFCMFFYGETQVDYPFGNGVLCISPYEPGLFRLPPAGLTSPSGTGSQVIDFEALATSGAIEPNSTWNFQMIYRDVDAPGAGFNTSHALSVPFCP